MESKQYFISYSRKDGAKYAEELYDALEAEGYNVWMDIKASGIQAGAFFDDAIKNAIESSDIVLFVVTSESVKSQFCRNELTWADNNKKTIIPLRFEDVELPFMINRVQWIDFSESIKKGLAKLRQRLSQS